MKLHELRRAKNLTQTDIARIMNLSPNTISGWENGKADPSIANLKKLCDVLDCSADELLGFPPRDSIGGISIEKLRRVMQILEDDKKDLE